MFVIPSLRDGGAERVITRLSTGMVESGYEVHILEFFRPDSGYSLDKEVHLHSMFQREDEYSKTGFLKRTQMMRDIVLKNEPDVIIPFLEYVCQKTQIALIGTKYFKRVVVTLRVTPTIGSFTHKLRRFVSIAVSKACISQTESQKAYLPSVLHKKTFVIPNPVDEIQEPFNELNEPFTFIAAGRLVPQKNYPLMLRAFEKVAKQRKVFLRIYGNGQQAQNLKAFIDELKISDCASLMGYSKNIINEYRKANAFLLTSNWEGMPNSLMEAMALGMPCIATDCPTGPAELIKDGDNGLLLPMDDEESLVDAMLKLVDDKQLRIELGANARKYIMSEYSLPKITEHWVQVMRDLNLL